MEIDLELPSGEDDKSDGGPNVDVDNMNGSDVMHVVNEDVNPPTVCERVREHLESNTDENVIDNRVEVGPSSLGIDSINNAVLTCEPRNGLEFESKEAAYAFYREYARSVGFGITIKASRRSKRSGRFIDVKIACSRFGNKPESSTTVVNPRSCPKTDCKASLHMKRNEDGKWMIYNFIKEHNHEICPDDFYCAIKGKNKPSANAACQKTGLQLALDECDVRAMLEYFMLMQDENPDFLYAVDLDKEKRLRNVFWIDPKARHDYLDFHDVILFDTMSVRNLYKVPFVPIVGVNHHCQVMLFGCALIGEETTSSFVWLMRMWLRAMGNKAPRVILTDQCTVLKEAIGEVFPDACHCFCLWHILGRIPKNLGHVIKRCEKFMTKFNKCIYRSWTVDQFEKRWWKMVDRYELREDNWVQSLYEERQMWVPTFMRGTFLGGMSTPVRSESMVSSFLDTYIQRGTTFKEFIEQYKTLLREICDVESKSDFETRDKEPELGSLLPFAKQMSTVYTHAVFKKFEAEVLGAVACHPHKDQIDGEAINFRVDDFEGRQSFMVAWNEVESVIYCSCCLFEYQGFLCRHAMIVLHVSGVSKIPRNYILRRWTREAKRRHHLSDIPNGIHYRVHRFSDLCRRAIKLGKEGSLSQETYSIAISALEEALKHCVGLNNSVRSVSEPNSQSLLEIDDGNHGYGMGGTTKKKKTIKKRKASSEAEVITIRMQDTQQEQMNSRVHILDNSYVPQQDIPVMEQLGSRAPPLDSYYSAHPGVEGVGQLNPISPIRDGYYPNQQMQGPGRLSSIPTRVTHYGTQQSMQGLLQGQLSFSTNMHGCFDIHDSLQDMEQSVIGPTQFSNISSKSCMLHDKQPPR